MRMHDLAMLSIRFLDLAEFASRFTQTREQIQILLLWKLGEFINSNEQKLGRGIAVGITSALQISKRQCRIAGERPLFLIFVPIRVTTSAKPSVSAIHQRIRQRKVGEIPSDNQGAVAWD